LLLAFCVFSESKAGVESANEAERVIYGEECSLAPKQPWIPAGRLIHRKVITDEITEFHDKQKQQSQQNLSPSSLQHQQQNSVAFGSANESNLQRDGECEGDGDEASWRNNLSDFCNYDDEQLVGNIDITPQNQETQQRLEAVEASLAEERKARKLLEVRLQQLQEVN
jgi:hypothetical protein